jgi:uncharacterized membrane protein YkoI
LLERRLFLGAAALALLGLAGAAVTITSQGAFAGNDNAACATRDEADDAAETGSEEADTDSVEDECGSQDEAGDSAEGDADDDQDRQLNGSIRVDESQYAGLSETDESAALASLATITPEQAIAAARAEVPGDSQKVELDNENGSLVYSVEIGGKDVKVDAGTGAVLHVDSDGPED